MTISVFIICTLATYRLSLMLSKEDGPYLIFSKIREYLRIKAKNNPEVKKTAIHEGIKCQWCSSVWCATLVGLYLIWGSVISWYQFPLHVLAFSAGAIIVNQAFTKG